MEMYRGMLSIPYLRRSSSGDWSVVSIRFRCIVPDCTHEYHGKYNTMAGDRPRLFNTLAIINNDDTIAVCEGEIDAITASLCGVPAVGVPGVDAWQPHFSEPFLGYETVYVLADNDDNGQGMKFASGLAKELPNVKIIPMPKGEDVNSTVIKHGKSALLERIK